MLSPATRENEAHDAPTISSLIFKLYPQLESSPLLGQTAKPPEKPSVHANTKKRPPSTGKARTLHQRERHHVDVRL